jgi:uncharacterized protein YjlB
VSSHCPVGNSIVATWEPHQTTVLEVIKTMGVGLEIIFNKGAVMILPSGVNKATGLAAALQDLRLSPHNVVGVGDAENDHAFLKVCGCSVAVDNAIPAVKDTADLIMRGSRGKGVEQLIDRMIKRDHGIVSRRHDGIVLGSAGGDDIYLSPTDTVLIAGSSGIGKSTLATALTERFVEGKFQSDMRREAVVHAATNLRRLRLVYMAWAALRSGAHHPNRTSLPPFAACIDLGLSILEGAALCVAVQNKTARSKN